MEKPNNTPDGKRLSPKEEELRKLRRDRNLELGYLRFGTGWNQEKINASRAKLVEFDKKIEVLEKEIGGTA